MKKFLIIALLVIFAGKMSFAQAVVSDVNVSNDDGPYVATYGHFGSGVLLQTGNSLPSGGYFSLISVYAVGYTQYTSDVLGYCENDESDAGYFVDLSDYDLNYAAYDYVVVEYEMAYFDGTTFHDFKHDVTYAYWPY